MLRCRWKDALAPLLVAVALLGLSAEIQAQPLGLGFDPRLEWKTLTTEHFRVHFPQGLEGVAHLTAQYAEEFYPVLVEEFGEVPPVIDIVLVDPFDFSNGFATVFPNDEVVLFASQYRLSDWFNVRLESWWKAVLFHELVHAVDLDQTRGWPKLLRGVLGKIVLPNTVKPIPFIEGLAVYEKCKHLGECRMNDAKTRQMLRQMVLDNKIPTFDEIKGFYTREEWPFVGLLVYNFGAWLMQYIEETYGDDALRRFNEVNGSRPLNLLFLLGFGENLDRVFQEAFGVSSRELYEGFRRWLREQFTPEIERIIREGLTPALRITTHGFFTESPAWSPAIPAGEEGETQEWIAYTHSGRGLAGLRLVSPEGEQDREVVPGGRAMHPTWTPDGRALVYAKPDFNGPYAIHSDLYRYDLEEGREERLTWGERAYYARVAPDGKIYYARNIGHDGSTALQVLDPETGETRTLKEFPDNSGVIHSFAISPDGTQIALALWRWGGYQDLYLLSTDADAEGGALTPLTQDKHQVGDPVWTPDGRYILFSADPDRVYNLYAYRVSDGKFFRVTNVLTGAVSPTVSPDGDEIAFVGYGSEGYDIYKMPLRPETWEPVEFPQETLPEWTGYPETQYPIEPYSPWASLVPRFWLPLPLFPGAGVGVFTMAQDALFQHFYTVLAGWDFEANAPSLTVTYVNNQIVPAALFAMYSSQIRSLGGSVTVPLLPSLERQQAVTVGYAYAQRLQEPTDADEDEDQDEAEGAEAEPETGSGEEREPVWITEQEVSGSYAYSRTRSRERFRDTMSLTLSGRLFRREVPSESGPEGGGEEGTGTETETGWRKALTLSWWESIRLPVEPSQWVSLRFQAGWTDSDAEEDAFELGGPYGPFVLRGFPQGAFSGKQAVSLGVQYAFNLFPIERGLGGWPVFLDDVGARLFVDAGIAGDELNAEEIKVGFGAELALSVTLDYRLPATVLLGVAQGVGEARPQFYFNVDLPIF